MIYRALTKAILSAVSDTPVTLINGPRQAGKSTLVQWLSSHGHPAQYLTLDDATTLTAAYQNPEGFLSAFDRPIVLDEVQRAPELFPAMKVIVDRKRTPGRFLLTGSANM